MTSPGSMAALFAAGIATRASIVVALWLLAAGLGLWAASAAGRGLGRAVAAALLVVAAGIGCAAWRMPRPWLEPPSTAREHVGVVLRPAVARRDGGWRLRVATAELVLDVRAAMPARPGEVVRVLGRVRPLRGLRNFGGVDRAASARADGLEAELVAESLTVIGRDDALAFAGWRALGALRARWGAAMGGAASDQARAVLRGVTLGERSGIGEALWARWRAVGVVHVLSVSGLHLAVVALAVFALLRRLAAVARLGANPARVALAPAAAVAIGYTMLTGAEVATLRALVVALSWMVAAALGRPLRLIDALGVAALLLLAWAPAQLWQPSFQLSFAAALVLALRPAGEHADVGASTRWRRGLAALGRWLARGVVSSAWVAVITAPITAWWFQEVAPGGVLGNVVITPLIELVALPLGLLGVVAWELAAPVGEVLFGAAALAISGADEVASWLAAVSPVGSVGISEAWLAIALWAVASAACALSRVRWALALAALASVALWRLAPLAPPDGARVTFFDVGQGDAALIEAGEQLWLVDAGGHPGAATIEGAAAPGRAIRQYLTLLGRDELDVVSISHPHPDHYLGLLDLLGAPGRPAVRVRELWLPPRGLAEPGARAARDDWQGGGAMAWPSIVEALRARGTVVRPPPEAGVSAGAAQLEVLAPRHRDVAGGRWQLAADSVRSINDNSVVAVLRYAGRSVLFAGDVELEGEDVLLGTARPALRVDVVKVPHHGSRTSSSEAFVRATGARLAVISCGAGNRFGFPAAAVVERWRAAGAEVLRTDRGGAVRVEISQRGAISLDRP